SPLFPYTTLFRSRSAAAGAAGGYPDARVSLRGQRHERAETRVFSRIRAEGDRGTARVRLARQRARAQEYRRAQRLPRGEAGRADRRNHHRTVRVANRTAAMPSATIAARVARAEPARQ